MIETLPDPNIYTLAAAGVTAGGIARAYYGEEFNDIPWQPIRVTFVPIVHKLAERKLGEEFYAAYDVSKREHVATLDVPHEDVVADLEAEGYVVEPLAAVKTDWNGNQEVASYAKHYGSKPFPGAPTWLKERQIHVTLFPTEDGEGTIVTAHAEANSWRPDLVEEHYRGIGMDIDEGREEAASDLEIDLEEAST